MYLEKDEAPQVVEVFTVNKANKKRQTHAAIKEENEVPES